MAKTVVFDFDGVIHSYTSGWQGATNIPDPPVPGIQKALKEIHDAGYEVVVVSTRCKTALGRMAIENWIDMYGMTQEVDKVCKEKPPAIAYIDDRAICFDGHPENLLKKIQSFEPWYKTPTLTPQTEWVSVEERLPESIVNKVLVYCENGYIGYGHYEKYQGEETWYNLENGEPFSSWSLQNCLPYKVTHWMPLPKPPEGKDGDANHV